MLLPALVLLLAPADPPPSSLLLAPALRRLSEEAEAFARVAPDVLSEEICRQKAARTRRTLHFRMGPSPVAAPELRYDAREIVSEYGFAVLKQDGGTLHELRRVVSVDGKPVEPSDKARRKLTMALTDANDRERRRLLREFEDRGLEGAAVDFGQSLLLFTRRRLEDYEFSVEGRENVGPDPALVLSFKQRGGSQAFTVFDRTQVVRRPLQGRLWVRQPDSLPLRLELRTARRHAQTELLDVAVVDFAMSPHGALMPVSVLYREHLGRILLIEISFQYGPFRRFAANAEIKFTEAPEPPPHKQPK